MPVVSQINNATESFADLIVEIESVGPDALFEFMGFVTLGLLVTIAAAERIVGVRQFFLGLAIAK